MIYFVSVQTFINLSSMAEAAQNRVQSAMKDFINNIDKTKLRPIQRQMYVCNAQCMDDPSASMEEVSEIQNQRQKTKM